MNSRFVLLGAFLILAFGIASSAQGDIRLRQAVIDLPTNRIGYVAKLEGDKITVNVLFYEEGRNYHFERSAKDLLPSIEEAQGIRKGHTVSYFSPRINGYTTGKVEEVYLTDQLQILTGRYEARVSADQAAPLLSELAGFNVGDKVTVTQKLPQVQGSVCEAEESGRINQIFSNGIVRLRTTYIFGVAYCLTTVKSLKLKAP